MIISSFVMGNLLIGSALAATTELEILVEDATGTPLLLTEITDFEQGSLPSSFVLSNGGTLISTTNPTTGAQHTTCLTYNEPQKPHFEFCLPSSPSSKYSISADYTDFDAYDVSFHVRVDRTSYVPGVIASELKNGTDIYGEGPFSCTSQNKSAAESRCDNACTDQGYSASELTWEYLGGNACFAICECGMMSDQEICFDCPAETFSAW